MRKPVRRQASHRTHPAIAYPAPPGKCRWCYSDIATKEGRINYDTRFCGRLCSDMFTLHTDPKAWRAYVYKRDMGICRECGIKHPQDAKTWEADHIEPLFIAGADWNFWSPLNGQVLCKKPCHATKTWADNIRFGLDKPRRKSQRR